MSPRRGRYESRSGRQIIGSLRQQRAAAQQAVIDEMLSEAVLWRLRTLDPGEAALLKAGLREEATRRFVALGLNMTTATSYASHLLVIIAGALLLPGPEFGGLRAQKLTVVPFAGAVRRAVRAMSGQG